MTQSSFLSKLCKEHRKAIIVGSIGTISYDLTNINHPKKILIRGAMGAALGCALGISLYVEDPVICVIGDGSFLMKMGSLSTIMRYKPKNLRVIVLDNGCYKSCGGQKTNFRYIRRYLPKFVEIVKV